MQKFNGHGICWSGNLYSTCKILNDNNMTGKAFLSESHLVNQIKTKRASAQKSIYLGWGHALPGKHVC